MKAIITVIGKDTKGIIAKVSGVCANFGVNIVDISQSVMKDYFAMIMLVELDDLTVSFGKFSEELKELGTANDLVIEAMHEDIFNSMHRI